MSIKMFLAGAAGLAAVASSGTALATVGTASWAVSGSSNNYGGYWDAASQGSRNPTASPSSNASVSYTVGGLAGTASASADLASGKLRASAIASTAPNSGINESRGEAFWWDEIRFDATGGGMTTIKLLYQFHGTQTGDLYDLYYASTQVLLGGAGFSIERLKNGGFGAPEFRSNYANWTSFNMTGSGDTYDVEATFSFAGPSASFNIGASLVTIAQGNATSNFANTSTFRFVLPENVTMTSQSGVFLTNVNAVPEPASWALLITGFGLAGGVARRRVRVALA